MKKTAQSIEPSNQTYPPAKNPRQVGKYNLLCNSGGGFLFKDVLEYRVWVHGKRGDDVCHTFDNYPSAKEFSDSTRGAEQPLVLVLQNPWINWNGDHHDYELIREDRIAEWCVEWLVEDMSTGEPEAVIAKLRREHPDGNF